MYANDLINKLFYDKIFNKRKKIFFIIFLIIIYLNFTKLRLFNDNNTVFFNMKSRLTNF